MLRVGLKMSSIMNITISTLAWSSTVLPSSSGYLEERMM